MEPIPLSRFQTIKRIRAELAQRFPRAFMPKGAHKRPLKVGIRADIKAAWPEVSDQDLDRALQDYVGGFTYLVHVVLRQVRLGLDGEPFGSVTESEELYAAGRVAKLRRQSARGRRRVIEADRLASLASAAE